jgi:hypothetical protein
MTAPPFTPDASIRLHESACAFFPNSGMHGVNVGLKFAPALTVIAYNQYTDALIFRSAFSLLNRTGRRNFKNYSFDTKN